MTSKAAVTIPGRIKTIEAPDGWTFTRKHWGVQGITAWTNTLKAPIHDSTVDQLHYLLVRREEWAEEEPHYLGDLACLKNDKSLYVPIYVPMTPDEADGVYATISSESPEAAEELRAEYKAMRKLYNQLKVIFETHKYGRT